jgi:hypothetical protein
MNPFIKKIYLIGIILIYLTIIINCIVDSSFTYRKKDIINIDMIYSNGTMKNSVVNISYNKINLQNSTNKNYFEDYNFNDNFNTTEIVAMISFYIITILIVIITFLFINHKI